MIFYLVFNPSLNLKVCRINNLFMYVVIDEKSGRIWRLLLDGEVEGNIAMDVGCCGCCLVDGF